MPLKRNPVYRMHFHDCRRWFVWPDLQHSRPLRLVCQASSPDVYLGLMCPSDFAIGELTYMIDLRGCTPGVVVGPRTRMPRRKGDGMPSAARRSVSTPSAGRPIEIQRPSGALATQVRPRSTASARRCGQGLGTRFMRDVIALRALCTLMSARESGRRTSWTLPSLMFSSTNDRQAPRV